jgi:hypothetical protein
MTGNLPALGEIAAVAMHDRDVVWVNLHRRLQRANVPAAATLT